MTPHLVWDAYRALERYARLYEMPGVGDRGLPTIPFPAATPICHELAGQLGPLWETMPLRDASPEEYTYLYLFAQWRRCNYAKSNPAFLGVHEGWTGLVWLPIRALRASDPERAKAAWGKMLTELRSIPPEDRQRIYPIIKDPILILPGVLAAQEERARRMAEAEGLPARRYAFILASRTIRGNKWDPLPTPPQDGGWHPWLLISTQSLWAESSTLPGVRVAYAALRALMRHEEASRVFSVVVKKHLTTRTRSLVQTLDRVLSGLGGRDRYLVHQGWRRARRRLLKEDT